MRIRANKFVGFKECAFAVTISSLMTLGRATAPPASEPGSGAGPAASATASTNSEVEVKVDNFAFTPGVVTVKAGTQITWINNDDIPHTVDSTEGKFKSAALDTGEQFQFRFTEPGEYPYYCRMHPKMTGKIVVQP